MLDDKLNKAEKYTREGVRLANNHSLDEAIVFFKKAHNISPSFHTHAVFIWDEGNLEGDPTGKVWLVGTDEVFEWNTSGAVNDVNLEYSTDGSNWFIF